MSERRLATTSNRSVVGIMNEFAFLGGPAGCRTVWMTWSCCPSASPRRRVDRRTADTALPTVSWERSLRNIAAEFAGLLRLQRITTVLLLARIRGSRIEESLDRGAPDEPRPPLPKGWIASSWLERIIRRTVSVLQPSSSATPPTGNAIGAAWMVLVVMAPRCALAAAVPQSMPPTTASRAPGIPPFSGAEAGREAGGFRRDSLRGPRLVVDAWSENVETEHSEGEPCAVESSSCWARCAA